MAQIQFSLKKKKRLTSRTQGNPHPFTPDNILFLPYALPQSGRHKCISPLMALE